MNDRTTMHIGPLGSTVHVLRADADTVTALAAVDWSRHFRRVCLDPVRGLIVLMSPSRLHESLTGIFDDIVDVAGSALAGASDKLGRLRLRGRGEPSDTGMEPDCAFYVGERARGYFAACDEGEAAADAYVEHTAPDLVVEVEITSADKGKAERYAEMGVRELWRHARPKGFEGAAGRIPRLATRGRAATARRLRSAHGADAGRCLRSGGGGAGRPDPRTSVRRRWPGSCAAGSAPACASGRRRRRTLSLLARITLPRVERAISQEQALLGYSWRTCFDHRPWRPPASCECRTAISSLEAETTPGWSPSTTPLSGETRYDERHGNHRAHRACPGLPAATGLSSV